MFFAYRYMQQCKQFKNCENYIDVNTYQHQLIKIKASSINSMHALRLIVFIFITLLTNLGFGEKETKMNKFFLQNLLSF